VKAHQVEQFDLAAIIFEMPNNRFAGGRIEKCRVVQSNLLRAMAPFIFLYLFDNLGR
jgi:hypothetical protein